MTCGWGNPQATSEEAETVYPLLEPTGFVQSLISRENLFTRAFRCCHEGEICAGHINPPFGSQLPCYTPGKGVQRPTRKSEKTSKASKAFGLASHEAGVWWKKDQTQNQAVTQVAKIINNFIF